MTKTDPRGRYKGELAQPIKMGPISGGLLNPYGAEERWRKELTEKRVRKLPALFAHYGIDPKAPGAAAELAIILAITHVPGFEPARKRGAKPKGRGLSLWASVRLKLAENNGRLSVAAACKALAKKSGQSAATMRRRYVEANKRYGPLVADLSADDLRAMLQRAA